MFVCRSRLWKKDMNIFLSSTSHLLSIDYLIFWTGFDKSLLARGVSISLPHPGWFSSSAESNLMLSLDWRRGNLRGGGMPISLSCSRAKKRRRRSQRNILKKNMNVGGVGFFFVCVIKWKLTQDSSVLLAFQLSFVTFTAVSPFYIRPPRHHVTTFPVTQ